MFGALANLFVEIGAKTGGLDRAFAGVRAKLAALASTPIHISPLGMGLALAGTAALGAGLARVLKAGSDLNETINKTGVIFGDQAGIVSAAADDMASKYGVVKKEFMDLSSEYGNLLQGMGGMTRQASAEMSVLLSKAAADSSSIFNASFEEAAGKIASAIRGQSEPISAFGVDVQEAAVKQEALRLGLAKGSQELDTQTKVAARASLVLRGLGVAAGDLDNTISGFANASRSAAGRLENLEATIGQQILPAFEAFLGLINDVFTDLTEGVNGSRSVLQGFADFVTGMVETLGAIWRNWGLIVQYVGIEAGGVLQNIGEAVSWLGDAFGAFLGWLGDNWRTIFADLGNWALKVLQNLGDNILNFFTALWETIRSGFSKPFEFHLIALWDGIENSTPRLQLPELKLSSVADQLREVADKMNQAEQARADAARPKGQGKPGERAAAEAARRKGEKLEIVALAEWSKKIQTSLKGDGDHAREAARGINRAVQHLGDVNRQMQESTAATREANTRAKESTDLLKDIKRNTGMPQPARAG